MMTKEDWEDFAAMRRNVDLERSRERLKKIAAALAAALFWAGLMVILGTAGAADMADEAGEVYPIGKMIGQCLIGFLMMLPGWRLMR